MLKTTNISWQALEFEHHEKNGKWFLWLLIFGLALLGYAAWQKDFFMFLTFFLLILAIYLYARKKPKTVMIELAGRGIKLDADLYPYSTLKAFWIIYEPPQVKIVGLETTHSLNRELILQLDDMDPNTVREFLLQYLPEDLEREENYSDKLMRKLRF